VNARLRPNIANGLHWVRGEIEQSLSRVRTLVEQHAENASDPLPLQQAFVELHQVRGTAGMIQCHGVAELAEEMKLAVGDLLHGRIREAEAAYSALLGATVLLNDYLESLAEGVDDCVLILQPAINELRLARGKSVLTEADLFAAQLNALNLILPLPDDEARVPGAAQQQAQKYLSVYQASLLHWLKNQADAETALARLGKVSELLAGYATQPAVHQLWRVMAATVEALLGHALEDSLDLKRLIGRTAGQIKQMAAEGEDVAAAAMADLSLQLLYYIGRSRGQGPRVTVLRKAFQLSQLLPTAAQLEDLRRRIQGPNTTLLTRVSEEVRSEFSKVKDIIDLAVRAGGKGADFEQTRQILKRIADTLSILGLGTLQRVVSNQSRLLDNVSSDPGASPVLWMELATSILRVEHSLEDALFHQLRHPGEPEMELPDRVPHSRDLAEGIDALYRESLVNLAKLKTFVDSHVRGQDGGGSALFEAAKLMDEIAAVFRMLQDERAAGLATQLARYVRSPAFQAVRDSKEKADRFADAIACVEYYVEAIRDNLPDAGFILDNLAKFVEQLDFAVELLPEPAPVLSAEGEPETEAVPAAEPAAEMELPAGLQSLADLVLSEAPTPAESEAAMLPASTAAEPPPARASAPPAPVSAPLPTFTPQDIDPEIREIFLEEAGEVLQSLQAAMPRWTRDPADRESLTTIRRAYHTLKGSGRMVGATHIGEFGWALEQLLNKSLDGSIAVSASLVAIANEAVEMLPSLIEQFRDDHPPERALARLIERAQNLAAGRSAEEQAEPDLVSVFQEDAREKVASVGRSLAAQPADALEHAIDDSVVRAYHTLRGAGHVVAATAVAELAGALEAHLESLRGAKLRLRQDDMKLLEDANQTLAEWIEQVGTPAAEAQDARPWLERIEHEQSRAHVPEDAVKAAEERQLAEIFSGEALDLVHSFDETVAAWAQAPDNRQAPQDLRVVLHTLKGAAYMSNCDPIGDIAKALHARLDQCINSGLVPDGAAFESLNAIAEGVYQLLDAYRDQRLGDQGSVLLMQVLSFPWQQSAGAEPVAEPTAAPVAAASGAATDATTGPAAEPEVIEIPAVETGAQEMSAAEWFAVEELPPVAAVEEAADPAAAEFAVADIEAIDIEAAEPMASGAAESGDDVIEMPPVAELETEPEALAAAAQAEAESAAEPAAEEPPPEQPEASLDLSAMADRLAPAAPADWAAAPAPAPDEEALAAAATSWVPRSGDADEEMIAVFLVEAEELLEALDRSSAALERNAHDGPANAELRRVLHTLKGSARMAGLDDLGEVGHQIETMLEQVDGGQRAADRSFFGYLHQASDGLHHALDDLRRGRIPDTQALLADLGVGPAQPAATEAPVYEAEAAWTAPAPAAVPEPIVAPAARAAASSVDERLRSYDAELGGIFAAEAAELLEALNQALQALQADAGNIAPIRELQRVLHTFKGGARMAGLNAMGDLAHDMETRINRIEAGLERADPAVVSELQAESEKLHHLLDLLERGDIAALLRAEDGTAEEPEAAPVSEVPVLAELRDIVPVPLPAPKPGHWDPLLFWRPEEESDAASLRRETARVPVEALDGMLNEAGEISIYRSRLEEHNTAMQAQLAEMTQAITRIRDQLRQMDTETDAQIAARGLGNATEQHSDRYAAEFDPLEMDRYTRMQELSRALSESVGDLSNLHGAMDELASEAETILLQQGRINTSVQQGLMRTLMVPFSRQVARLQRVVRQTAADNGKQAEAVFSGIESELDRNVLERMTAPLEHLLRNAVVHGIEEPDTRLAASKLALGRIAVSLWREGSQLLIEMRDDGRGLDFDAIRGQAIKRGLMPADAHVSDDEAAQFIFQPGFSTAKKLTQDAGRGIGMDVVASEVKQLGGTLELTSQPGLGARFLVRLPLTLAMSQALLVSAGHEQYAILLSSVEGIARIPRDQLDDLYREDGGLLNYGGNEYRVRYLGDFIGVARDRATEGRTVSAVLVKLGEGLVAGERRIAVVVDQLLGNREIVSKAVGPQVSSIAGVTGATILADGRVVLTLDPGALAQDRARRALTAMAVGKAEAIAKGEDERDLIMVVDDSITIRRVTERLLLKNGYRVITAKDGLDAMAQLQTENPAAILLDIEMPRADGFEVAAFVRNSTRIADTPIIMITSRSGDKHRERARSIGVNRYMIKPYQEDQLMSELRSVMKEAVA